MRLVQKDAVELNCWHYTNDGLFVPSKLDAAFSLSTVCAYAAMQAVFKTCNILCLG